MAVANPVRRQTVGPIAKGVTSAAIDVTIGGQTPTYVEMTPSLAPDPGSVHQMGLNTSATLLDNPTAAGATAMRELAVELNDDITKTSPYRVSQVYIKSGKDGTSFDVISIL